MKRRLTAAGLLLAVMLLLSPSGRASAPAGVYFTAANDNLLELNAETMPFYSNNVLYVSSRVFDGTGLGVSYTRSTSLGVAMLYNTSTDLRFDLAGQIAYDKEGNLYSGYAIEQGGVVFFPLALVCRYFGLTWSYSETDVAPLIRVKNSSVILGDATFIDAAASLIQPQQPPEVGVQDGVAAGDVEVGQAVIHPAHVAAVVHNVLHLFPGHGVQRSAGVL